jgi:hypothetical protein
MNINPGDIIHLRKKHPCGSNEWEVISTGIDIRIKCLGCQRYLLMDRFVLERKIKALASKHDAADNGSEQK